MEAFDTDPSPDGVVAADLRSKSLTMTGDIDSARVTILVDTDSSYDFLHPCITECLHLSLSAIIPFRIYVGNGESIVCSHMSNDTPLIVQETSFMVDLYILHIHGPNVILGMEWLESLGRVTTDYVAKSMGFFTGNDRLILRGEAQPPQRISTSSLAQIMTSSSLF